MFTTSTRGDEQALTRPETIQLVRPPKPAPSTLYDATRTPGATPFEAKPLSAPAIRLATQVPWPSRSSVPQSVRPAALSAFSPYSCFNAAQGTKVCVVPTFSFSSRCDACTPVSRTATVTVLSPRVVAHAAGTFMRASSHWRIPSGLVTPRNDEASCQGSGNE